MSLWRSGCKQSVLRMFGYTLSAYPLTIPALQDPTSLVFTCREPSLMSSSPSLQDTQLRNPEALFSVHVSSHPDCPDS